MTPFIIWSLLSGAYMWAFGLFVVAGLSDAVDGAIARMFDQQSELGTVLDPLADKTLLVSVFIVLGVMGNIPLWLTILVFSRDLLIVAGIILCFVIGRPVKIKPLWVSKANTLAQITLASLVLGLLAFQLELTVIKVSLEIITGLLTGFSALAYVFEGIKHLGSNGLDRVDNQ